MFKLNKIALTLTVFLLTLFSFACSNSNQNNEDVKPLNIARADLAEATVANLEKEFRKINSSVKSSVVNIHPDQIINSLVNGSIDVFIGTVAVPKVLQDSIKQIPIARDGVVLVVNPTNKLRNISKEEVGRIFSGAVNSWKKFGDENKPIMVVQRDPASVERRTFEKKVFNGSAPSSDRFVKVDTVDEVKDILGKFPNAISYVNFSSLDKSSMKSLSIGNIPATSSNIAQGYFPLSRKLYMYFNPDYLKDSSKYTLLKEFASLVLSEKGQNILAKSGVIPLSEAELQIANLNHEPIYLGVAAPKQDSYMDLGRSIINGASLAVMELDQLGGIEGRPVELIDCDDKGTTRGAVDCATKFVESKVLGVIGHLNSQTSIEASKIYAKNNIVQITPAATHPWFTERPNSKGFVYRTCGRDDQEAKIIAAAINKLPQTHPLKVSIFHNGTFYGSTLASLIEDEITRSAVDEVVGIVAIRQGQQQYFNEVQNLKAKVLVFVGEYGEAAALVKALALNNKNDVTFFGSDGTYSQRFIEDAGLRSEGAYIIGSTLNLKSTALKQFNEVYKDTFKSEANAFAMNSYDATKILLQAIEQSKMKHSIMIAKEVKDTNYQGITGSIAFDEKGDPIFPRLALYRIASGRFVKQ